MRHTNDPVEMIRNTNPVPDAHQLPDDTHTSFEALFEEIIGMEHQQPTTTRSHRRPRIGRIAALAAAFVVLSAGVAMAAGVFSPNPKDVALVEEGPGGFETHEPGWRPALRTESVWCMYDLTTGADTRVSEFPLGQPLTMDVLLTECGKGNDVARNLNVEPSEYTLCKGTFTDETYRNRIAQDDRFNIIEGDLSADRPGFPVVLAWNANCAATKLDTSLQVDLAPFSSLDELNHEREVEIGLRADALESCLTRDEADQAARAARTELGDEWLLVDMTGNGPVDCYGVDLEPEWGTIGLMARDGGTQTADGATQSTTPPTSR